MRKFILAIDLRGLRRDLFRREPPHGVAKLFDSFAQIEREKRMGSHEGEI
jgi:hypothetical protein